MITHTFPMPAPALPKKQPEPPRATGSEMRSPSDDRFVDAMLETPFCKNTHRNPLEWVVSLVLHTVIIGVILLIPLYFTDSLDLRAFTTTFLIGPPPPPPPAAPQALAKVVKALPKERFVQSGRLMSPVAIPREIAMVKEAPLPPDTSGDGVVGGVPGGIPGGQVGGVLGGIIGGTNKIIATPSAPPPPAKRIVVIGGQIKPPRLLFQPEIAYPPLARSAGVQGSVRIDAIVDEEGNVVQAHIVDGPALLLQPAMAQVTKWKYEPTLLNGQPVSVRMIIYVNYHLH